MFKRYVISLIICLLFTHMSIAYADIIIEPDNDFYKQHQGQINTLGRSFVANGESGSVGVKKEPGARSDWNRLQNGEAVYIQYSCLYNGAYWGITEWVGDKTGGKFGWVKLDEMLVLYDYVSFDEDHLDEFYAYRGDYAAITETRAALAWPWPGSEAPLWTVEDLDTENFRVSHAYTDEQGREWGFVNYLYGSRNIWVCLSEPLNRDIPVFNPTPAPARWVSETVHINIEESGNIEESENQTIVLIIVLVAAWAIGTVVLIKVFWKPDAVHAGGETK